MSEDLGQSLEEQIAAAVSVGDWELSRRLKHELTDRIRGEGHPQTQAPAAVEQAAQEDDAEVAETLRQKIVAAMAAGDWETSRSLKHQYVDLVRSGRA